MGSLDDDRSQAPSVNDDEAITAADNNDDTVDPREEHQDIWARSEGYTPLTDIQYTSLRVAMGPSDGEEEDDDNENDATDSDNDDNNDNEHDSHTSADDSRNGNVNGSFIMPPSVFPAVASMTEESTDSAADFEAIASLALSLLEAEYERTLNVEPRIPSWQEAVPTTVKDEIPSGQGIPTVLTTDDDEDLNIIAKAFDERNEQALGNGFVVDWDEITSTAPSTNTIQSSNKEATKASTVDTAAVRKVVQALANKGDNSFQKKFVEWQQQQQQQQRPEHFLPLIHGLIPATPYAAFRRDTDKAKQATASLSRSATMAEALQRLRDQELLSMDLSLLIIDVVGVDHTECESIARIQSTFRPIIRWIGTWKGCRFQKVHLRLVGRDLSNSGSSNAITEGLSVDLLTPNTATILESAIATCHNGVYHTWLSGLTESETSSITSSSSSSSSLSLLLLPHLVIAYNAGIWGYKDWEPTVEYLGQQTVTFRIPFVVTAYTLEECQEDFQVIETTVKGQDSCKVLWNPERNPFGSKVIRETKSRLDEYRENAAWQAWLLGKPS